MDTEYTRGGPEPAAAPGQPGFPVVGIGASAGGFQALIALLQAMPSEPGMALVVILHLSATEPSAADKVLQRATRMPVTQVSHTTRILPGKVYVIPPDRSLTMRDGHLVLGALDRASGRPVAIDTFLCTLAEAHGAQAIGVVLSGMGNDGTAGLACIKRLGGVAIVQSPDDAGHAGMPRAAIESGAADFVLAAADIPAKLLALADLARHIRREAGVAPTNAALPGPALGAVLAVLHARTGYDFTHYRLPTLVRCVERRMQVRGTADLAVYAALLGKDGGEARALLKGLLIGVTRFFRDPRAFEALEHKVLPGLFASLPEGQSLRAWVAACASGEEAYSLAMLLAERAGAEAAAGKAPAGVQVFASDLDEQAIRDAQAGLYPASVAEQLPPARLERHFTLEAGQYRVRKALREQVLFSRHDLLRDPPFGRVDLVSCRNLLIYLKPQMHRFVLQQFHFALNPGGFLLLGSAESAEAAQDLFAPVDAANRIFQARPVARVAPLPAAPAQEAPPDGRRGRLFSFADIHLHKAAELAPPSVLLDADADLLHLSEGAARFLRTSGGEPTRELAALVLPELQLPLRAALFHTRRGGCAASSGPVRYALDGGAYAVDMQIVPFQDEHAEGRMMLVRFVDVPDGAPQAPAGAPRHEGELARQLDEELVRTRRQLHDTVAQAERAGNEMRLYREEMHTTIEELRVHAEELDRNGDLLRSVKHELEADNRMLRERAETAAKAHDDLANLVASSGVATIFLDRAMCIVRFTPRVTDFFNLIAADIGRPLAHISHRLDYPALAEDAAQVFDTLQAMEREVCDRQGRHYIVRVHPYRTGEDRIEGAVMSFFDITSHRAAEAARREVEARLAALFDSLPVGVGVFDTAGDITLSNKALLRFLPTGRMPSRDPGRMPRWRAWDAQGRLLDPEAYPGARVLRGERVVPGVEMLYLDDAGREVWTQVSGVPVTDPRGEVIGQSVVIHDIDALKRSEAALRENEGRLRELAAEFARMMWETDASGMVVTDSASWRAYTGQTLDEWLGTGWLDVVHPDDRAYAARQWSEAAAARSMVDAQFRIRRADGRWQMMKVRAAPLVGADGRIRKWVGFNVEIDAGRREDGPSG